MFQNRMLQMVAYLTVDVLNPTPSLRYCADSRREEVTTIEAAPHIQYNLSLSYRVACLFKH